MALDARKPYMEQPKPAIRLQDALYPRLSGPSMHARPVMVSARCTGGNAGMIASYSTYCVLVHYMNLLLHALDLGYISSSRYAPSPNFEVIALLPAFYCTRLSSVFIGYSNKGVATAS